MYYVDRPTSYIKASHNCSYSAALPSCFRFRVLPSVDVLYYCCRLIIITDLVRKNFLDNLFSINLIIMELNVSFSI